MLFKHKVYFRADGNSTIGLGHVIRSLALAEMVAEDFECFFIIRNPLPALREQLETICKKVIELPEQENTQQEAQAIVKEFLKGDEIFVLDGYHFNRDYQQIIKDKGCKVLSIDDIHTTVFVADAIINHAGGITKNHYTARPSTQFYLGLNYALLRKPFRKVRKNNTLNTHKARTVFICLGGADPKNDTLKVIKKCEQLPCIGKCYVVIGNAFLYKKELNAYLQASTLQVHLLSNLSATEMVHYMQQCGLAITPPSTISYEYLSVGGTLYLKTIAANQLAMYKYLIEQGLAFDFNDLCSISESEKNEANRRSKNIFDGKQQKRLLRIFKQLILTIRRAVLEDSPLYFEWANEAQTRKQSYNSDPISYEGHIKWFQTKLNSPNTALYVILLNQNPIGQVRFDCSNNNAVISYSLDEKYRGKGLGTVMLQKSIVQFREDYGNDLSIVGYVRKENIPSIKAFRALSFQEEKTSLHKDSYKYKLI